MANASEFFHKIVDLLPWRQESDKEEAHETVEDTIAPLFGRNQVEPGVVKADGDKEPENPEDTKTPDTKTPDTKSTGGVKK